jgi:cytosine/creatinine deaminase
VPAADSLLLAGVTLAGGEVADVAVADGRIAAVTPPDHAHEGHGERLDLAGYLLLPAPAEPHAHLDKALTAARVPNPRGDLAGAVEAWLRHRPSLTREDVAERATRATSMLLANGATAIRSHVDVGSDIGLRSLEALLEVRQALRGQVTLQLVAMVSVPLTGPLGADHRALLRAAMERGADVVGGCPALDPDPAGCLEVCLEVAAACGRPVDLHTDETLDPAVLHLPRFAELVAGRGFAHGATASHCVSLGVQPPEVATKVAEQVAAAGMSVVCLPQTNLFLQGRGLTAAPRGLTALRELLAAGVTVAAGGDNLQDPFNALGRGDPLETASLLVAAGHLTPRQAWVAVSAGARAAMGLPAVRVEAGAPAELLAVRAASLEEAVAGASSDRLVLHRGRVVSRTVVTREPADPAPSPPRPREVPPWRHQQQRRPWPSSA